MRILVISYGLLMAGVGSAEEAQIQGAHRWEGWCEYQAAPSERSPSPRLNLPSWICRYAFDARLHEKYKIELGINPFFLSGDFNGDGKLDVALWVKESHSGKRGIIIVHGGKNKHVILGAGRAFGRRGDDLFYVDMWSIEPRGLEITSPYEEKKKLVLVGDALELSKSESAAYLVYWNGRSYATYQTSD